MNWLEFENESILKFLAKYGIICERGKSTNTYDKNRTKDFINVTVEEEISLVM
jgi:hypothetical protein